MTGSTVLVVRVPRPIENIDECTEYIRRGLRDGILILGADVRYSIETFPPLGAVEVVAENVPKSDTEKKPRKRRTPKKAVGEVGTPVAPAEPPAAPEAETAAQPDTAPPVTVFRTPAGEPKRRAAGGWRLPMTAGEIVNSYKQAAHPKKQIKVLADLNACSKETILGILQSAEVLTLPKGKAGGADD